MNKRIAFSLAIISICTQAIAQDSRLMLRLNSFSGYKTTNSINTYKAVTKDIRTLPSFGYARTFSNNIGLGAEFGFTNSIAKTDLNQTTSLGPVTKKNSRDYRSYYIGLTVYETFKLKKYIANVGVLLPLEFVKPQSGVFETNTVENTTNDKKKELITETLPKQLKTGLYLQASLYRQLVKKLYLGAEIGAGLSYIRTTGEQEQITENYVNGVMTSSLTSRFNVKQNTYDLGLKGTVSIQYIF